MVRDQIIQAAIQVFSEKGYDAAGMDEIAQKAGVAKVSLYYNFRSKSDLFASVVSEGMADLHGQIEGILNSSSTVRQIIEGLVRENLHACHAYPQLVELIMHGQPGSLAEDAEAMQRVRQAKEAYLQYIAGLLDEGMREGLLNQGDSRRMAAAYLAFLHAYYKAARPSDRSLPGLIREATDLIMHGLKRT